MTKIPDEKTRGNKFLSTNIANLFYAVLMLISIILLFTFKIPLLDILKKVFSTKSIFQDLLIIPAVMIFANILIETKFLTKFVSNISKGIRSPKIVFFFSSLGLGILPIHGRTLFSAPIVQKLAEFYRIDNKKAALLDFVLTHYYYLFSPISTSLILLLSITGLLYKDVVIFMFPILITMVVVSLYYMKGLPKKEKNKEKATLEQFMAILNSVYYMTPILVTIFLAIVSGQLMLGVIIGCLIALVMARFKVSWKNIMKIQFNLLFILIIILFFKESIKTSGIGTIIAGFFTNLGFPPVVLIIIIGLLSGFLLGSSKNMVLLSFPLAMPFFPEGQMLSYSVLLYISDFAGYMTSPAHTCPTIAREYFKVNLKYFYSHTARLSLLIIFMGIATFSLINFIH